MESISSKAYISMLRRQAKNFGSTKPKTFYEWKEMKILSLTSRFF